MLFVFVKLRQHDHNCHPRHVTNSLLPKPDGCDSVRSLCSKKKYEEAASVLTAAQKASPDNKNLAIQAGRAQLFGGEKTYGEATRNSLSNSPREK
jgi:hypothetical protein